MLSTRRDQQDQQRRDRRDEETPTREDAIHPPLKRGADAIHAIHEETPTREEAIHPPLKRGAQDGFWINRSLYRDQIRRLLAVMERTHTGRGVLI